LAFDRLSPGTTLFQMVVKDLIETEGIRQIQVGAGDPNWGHYRSYSYVLTKSAPCLLLRRTHGNRALMLSHSLFQSSKRWVANSYCWLRKRIR
jgi:hypothetical protein